MALSTAYFLVSSDGDHDKYQWLMHLLIWGQNQAFWGLTYFLDSELTRGMYYRSSIFIAFVPYVGLPIYLLWLIAVNIRDRDAEWSGTYFVIQFIIWTGYLFAMRAYS